MEKADYLSLLFAGFKSVPLLGFMLSSLMSEHPITAEI